MTRKSCSGSFNYTLFTSDVASHNPKIAAGLCMDSVIPNRMPRKRQRPGGNTPKRVRVPRPYHGPPTLCFGILLAAFLVIVFKQF